MRAFARLVGALGSSLPSGERHRVLADYFRAAQAPDAAWALWLLLGNRPAVRATPAELRELGAASSGVHRWLFDACQQTTGDLCQTVALLAFHGGSASGGDPPPRTMELAHVMQSIARAFEHAGPAQRRALLARAAGALDADELRVLLLIMRGRAVACVSRAELGRALAEASGVPPERIHLKLARPLEPTAKALALLLDPLPARDHALLPVPFMRLAQCDAENARSMVDRGDRVIVGAGFGGARAQIVRTDGACTLWSFDAEPISHLLPQLVHDALALPQGTVLEGELVCVHRGLSQPLDVAQLRSAHEGRQRTGEPLFGLGQPRFVARDVLAHSSTSVHEMSATDRWELLGALLAGDATQWSGLARMPVVSPAAAARWLACADGRSMTGVRSLLILRESAAGGHGWTEVRRPARTIRAVLVHAMPGSGASRGLHTELTLGVWANEGIGAGPGLGRALLPIARVDAELSTGELEALDGWIRANTLRRAGPMRIVEPTQVFEVAFGTLHASARARAGVVLGSARLVRWDRGASVETADERTTLLDMALALEGRQ